MTKMRDVNRKVIEQKPVHDMGKVHDVRKAYLSRWEDLQAEREPVRGFWTELAKYILPMNYKQFVSDRNTTSKARFGAILDNTATHSLHTLESGMQSGTTNPSADWFRMTIVTDDPNLAKIHRVRAWLDEVRDRMRRVFAQSNTYRVTHQMWGELGLFGTAATFLEPDAENVIHMYPLVAGSYCLQRDFRGNVVTMFREIQKTVGEVVAEFGIENCSVSVQNSFNSGTLENEVDILHVIEPRKDRDRNNPSPLHMPWRSVYMEIGGDEDRILREGGYDRFPVLAPRWAVYGDDVYGVGPAMEAIGDIRQLQQEQLRKGQAIDHELRPALQVPTEMRQRESSLLPGGVSYHDPGSILPYDQATPNGGVRRAFEVNLPMDTLLEDIQDIRMRIRRAFFADLFLMLANAGDNRKTATEILERQDEKLLALGPVLERLHNEMLKPMVEQTFNIMQAKGLLPEMPPELEGKSLEPEFISILAQAQKAVGTNSIDRMVGNLLTVSQARPDVLDKWNFDNYVDRYAEMLGVPTDMVVDDETVKLLRERRAQAEAAAQQAEMAQQQAAAYRDVASVPAPQAEQASTSIDEALAGVL